MRVTIGAFTVVFALCSSCVVHSGPARTPSSTPAPPPPPPPGTPAPPPPSPATPPPQAPTPTPAPAPPGQPAKLPGLKRPPVREPTPPKGPPNLLAAGIANGGPSADMRPGAQAAFWIWRDGAGWHLRTTTKTELHVFTGRVDGVSGPIAGLQPTRTEFGDHMQLQNGRIVFSFATQGHEDGFSFTTAPNNCVTFLLEMDGNLVPPIHIGPKKIQPPSRHFTLCP